MEKYSIPYVQVNRQYLEEKSEIDKILHEVLEDGHYVGGDIIEGLEEQLAALCGTKYAVALNSGTDALILGMIACGIGEGDEVITPPNSFIASTAAIIKVGAKPVFADVMSDQNIDPEAVESVITKKTKAIMPVHLTGRVCNMEALQDIAKKHGLLIIEDAAQSIGSRYMGKTSGSFGKIG